MSEAKSSAQERAAARDAHGDAMTSGDGHHEKSVLASGVTKFLFEYGKKQRFQEGTYIIREGHSDKLVFVILSGEVEVLKKDENGNDKVITTISGGGAILGEMSIFLDQPRTSSVRISKEAMALEFTGDNFINAVTKIPELSLRLLKSLSNKINGTNEAVTALSYSQAVLVCAAYLLDQRPNQNEKESNVNVSLQQIATETGLSKRVVRTTFERLNRRGVVMGLTFNQTTVSGRVNYPKLMRMLKSVTYPRPKQKSADEVKQEEDKAKPQGIEENPGVDADSPADESAGDAD